MINLNLDIRNLDKFFSQRVFSILNYQNPYSRSNQVGHITASGLVIKDDKVLLIFHPHIKSWFQPGGHIDEGESPFEAAIREVYEETGFRCLLDSSGLDPLDIDIHEIPANLQKGEDAHLHIDLLYRLKPIGEEKSSEDISWDWFSLEQVHSVRIRRALTKLSP